MSIEHKKSKNLNTGIAGPDSTRRKLPLGILSVLIALMSLLSGIVASFISSSLYDMYPNYISANIGFIVSFLSIILFLFFYLRNEGQSSSDEGLDDEK